MSHARHQIIGNTTRPVILIVTINNLKKVLIFKPKTLSFYTTEKIEKNEKIEKIIWSVARRFS